MKNAESQRSSLDFLMSLQILLLWNLALIHLAPSMSFFGFFPRDFRALHSSLLNKSHKTSWSWPEREKCLLLERAGNSSGCSREESRAEERALNWVSRWPSERWCWWLRWREKQEKIGGSGGVGVRGVICVNRWIYYSQEWWLRRAHSLCDATSSGRERLLYMKAEA